MCSRFCAIKHANLSDVKSLYYTAGEFPRVDYDLYLIKNVLVIKD